MEGGAMLKKFLMAAGLQRPFPFTPGCRSKVNVAIRYGQPGGYCYYNYDPFRCGGYGYYPRPGILSPIRSSGSRILQGSGLGVAGPRLSQHYYD
jgi:hypothetical protein